MNRFKQMAKSFLQRNQMADPPPAQQEPAAGIAIPERAEGSIDTDRNWEIIARHHPFFGVLANERYLGDTLPEDVRKEFYETGRGDIDFVVAQFEKHFSVSAPFDSAIDFGSGVGRLTSAMAAHCGRVTGVDISDSMLATAKAHASAANVTYQKTIPDTAVSWVNSHIVFQHIMPRRGMQIMRTLLERVAPGGVISIQVPFYKDSNWADKVTAGLDTMVFDGETVVPVKQRDEPEGTMHMFDYSWPAIFSALVDNGFDEYVLSHTNHGGAHGTWIFSRRNRWVAE